MLDTPPRYTDRQIRDSFVEFNRFNCPYKDCMHINEKECIIKNNKNILRSRYDNYKKFIEKR